VATVLAFLGILITAALFLRAFQKVFLGKANTVTADLTVVEGASITPLLVLAVVIGVFPRFLLDLIEPASRSLLTLLAR
jgi:NADH-quinone oxidoreductase subunit M